METSDVRYPVFGTVHQAMKGCTTIKEEKMYQRILLPDPNKDGEIKI